jgi:hypothetical protein
VEVEVAAEAAAEMEVVAGVAAVAVANTVVEVVPETAALTAVAEERVATVARLLVAAAVTEVAIARPAVIMPEGMASAATAPPTRREELATATWASARYWPKGVAAPSHADRWRVHWAH